jgi:hypothetical protein
MNFLLLISIKYLIYSFDYTERINDCERGTQIKFIDLDLREFILKCQTQPFFKLSF